MRPEDLPEGVRIPYMHLPIEAQLGDAIRRKRQIYGGTLEGWAEKIDQDPNSLFDLEHGRAKIPPEDMLSDWLDAWNVTPLEKNSVLRIAGYTPIPLDEELLVAGPQSPESYRHVEEAMRNNNSLYQPIRLGFIHKLKATWAYIISNLRPPRD